MIKKPTHNLDTAKKMILAGKFRITGTAEKSGLGLGFDVRSILDTVLALTKEDFYKTMESERNPGEWQDVYRPMAGSLRLYVKIRVSKVTVIISFKEK